MEKRPLKSMGKKRGDGREGKGFISRRPILWIALLCLLWTGFILPGKTPAEEGIVPAGLPTEQDATTQKFLASLESTLAQKFFHYRNRPVVRVAVFDFTDGTGNVVKGGMGWADEIIRTLYLQPQFDVVSRDQVNRYLNWSGLASVGKLDAAGLRLLQRRINTMDPTNGIHALITGEVKRGVGRSLQIQVYLTNFEFKVGKIELEENFIDVVPLSVEIPFPTEQALQEANEIVVRAEKKSPSEGRLLILANTRGNALLAAESLGQFQRDQPFPWDEVPYALTVGKEETTMPKQIQVGLEKIFLSPLEVPPESWKRLEYSFLHGKCATNEIYFDGMIQPMEYRLLASFIDLRSNLTYSKEADIQVYPGTTTVVVLSFYVPSEKERFRAGQTPRINVYQLFGKELRVLPKG
jgi:hypothetical protein